MSDACPHIVRWDELPDLQPIAAFQNRSVSDIKTELAGYPDTIHGVALLVGNDIAITAIIVDINLISQNKRALARVIAGRDTSREKLLDLIHWGEIGAKAAGARRFEVSIGRAPGLDSILADRGYRLVETMIRMRSPGPRPQSGLPANFTLRTLDEAGIDAWLDVGNETFRDVPFALFRTRKEAEDMMNSPGFDRSLVNVLYHQYVPVGFFHAIMKSKNEAEIDALGLLPQVRGRGLGSWLLRRAEHLLIEKGAITIDLHVALGNRHAYELYVREGYQEQSRSTVRETDV